MSLLRESTPLTVLWVPPSCQKYSSLVKRSFPIRTAVTQGWSPRPRTGPEVENTRPTFQSATCLPASQQAPGSRGPTSMGLGAVRAKVSLGVRLGQKGPGGGGHDLPHPSSCLTSPFLSFQTIVLKMESFLVVLSKCLVNKSKTKQSGKPDESQRVSSHPRCSGRPTA